MAVMLNDGNKSVRVTLNNIVFISAEGRMCRLVMSDGSDQLVCCSISSLESVLSKDVFVRIHRQYIINIWHVRTSWGGFVEMDNGKGLNLGKTYRHSLDGKFLVIACVAKE